MRFSIDSCYTGTEENSLKLYPTLAQKTNATEVLWRAEETLGELATAVEAIKLWWADANQGQVKAVFDGFLKMDGQKFHFQLQHDCLDQSTADSIIRIVRKIIGDHVDGLRSNADRWHAMLVSQDPLAK